ncbi:MAG TPA: TetR/AcrR family transcriptional regulator [Holophagaceae bacterium]|nr:TetR/AcrR family transcriptional regulator [Holophagaceae bacterium]
MPRRTAPKKKAPEGPLGREDWVKAALHLIARDGVQAVAVEPLARELGVTKGSFYWHFANRDALVEAALQDYEARQSIWVVEHYGAIADPRARLRLMLFSAFEDEQNGLTFAALAAASEDPRVKPYLRRVTENRMALGVASFKALGLDDEEARRRALFSYSAYAGYFQLLRAMPDTVRKVSDLSLYVRYLAEALLPEDLAPPKKKR